MKMPSNMTHRFSEVPQASIERSVFDRSHSHKTTFNPDYLIPFFIDEMLPGDTFNVDATHFIRMNSSLQLPIMDNLYLDTFYFFCPNRILWTNWVKFMGEQTNPGDTTNYVKPQIVADAGTGFTTMSLSDYFGLPTGVNSLSVDTQFHRMYNRIYSDWFRDENLINTVTNDTGNGPDTITNYVLQKRGKRHDYFTSCLPWAQKGTAVNIPLGTYAPILGLGKGDATFPDGAATVKGNAGANIAFASSSTIGATTGANHTLYVQEDPSHAGFPWIRADLTNATAATINSLRLAFQTQIMYERDARGGTRYYESIKSHFQVTDPGHAILQRPVFLGGKSTPIQISAVPQTSATNSQPTPAGSLSAFVLGTNTRDGFSYSATEHGLVMGIMMVRADVNYQKSLDKMFTRSTRLDYYFPALAHLGEQAVLSKELYCDGTSGDADVFGYQERWAEYRYARSKITGQLNSHATTPLDNWHLAQKFLSRPTLSQTFIEEGCPITRVEAVTTQPAFTCDIFIKNRATRPMPVFSVPGLIDHF